MNNFIILVLDGVGAGELPDAAQYGDAGTNTLANIGKKVNGLDLPNLRALGLGNITDIPGVEPVSFPTASFGKMAEVSKGKDSTTGHWELGGLQLNFDFSYFPKGFPPEITSRFLHYTGCKGFLGNKPASGTDIIKELGDEHIRTGYPIIYTSADSVFQIAAHEDIIPLERLYEICKITRNTVLTFPWLVGRVIARPFIGPKGEYTRTTNRKDFSLDPPGQTILDLLLENGIQTISVGKVNDLFNNRGIKRVEVTKSNAEGSAKLLKLVTSENNSLIFVNLVDFDVYFGHRSDPVGFAEALRAFDRFVPGLLGKLDESDALVITADHGNDPTDISTDHSREYVPLLFYRKGKFGKELGVRASFADVAKTAAEFFGIAPAGLEGRSFLHA